MDETERPERWNANDLAMLHRMLQEELGAYRRLLILARRQQRYLRRQDVPRLEENARRWAECLPQAQAVRRRREDFLAARAMPVSLNSAISTQWPGWPADNEKWQQLRGVLEQLVETAATLWRQNELNRQLAGYCLELAGEETEIFRRSVLEDPAGCYADDARKATAPPGGVLSREA